MYSLIDLIEQYGCFVSRLDLAVCIGASAGEKKASCPTSLPIVEVALAMGYCSPKILRANQSHLYNRTEFWPSIPHATI
jgi:hypothetical protein